MMCDDATIHFDTALPAVPPSLGQQCRKSPSRLAQLYLEMMDGTIPPFRPFHDERIWEEENFLRQLQNALGVAE